MARQRPGIPGRSDVLAALDRARATAGTGSLMLIRGPSGIGRSAVLDELARAWRRDGLRVVRAGLAGATDATGLDGLVRGLRDQFEHVGDARLIEATGMLAVTASVRSGDDPPDPASLVGVVGALADVARVLRAGGDTAVVLDDVDAVPAGALAASTIAGAGCLVVAAGAAGVGTELLARTAHTVVDLAPLPRAAIAELLRGRFARDVDDGLLRALCAALGELSGHAATVLSTVEDLDRAGRLVRAGGDRRGRLYLADDDVPVALPVDHPLVARVRAGGALAELLVTATAALRLRLDDVTLLAEATLGDADEYGEVLDDLIATGVVVPRGDHLVPACPALTARLSAEHGDVMATRLHRACAAALLRRAARGQRTDRTVLADHVTAAAHTIPRDGRTAADLAAAASGALGSDPIRAARWLRAALDHTGDGPRTGPIVDRLLALLVRTGRYDQLTETVNVLASRHGPWIVNSGRIPDLGAAAMLAALHTGIPIDPVVRAALRAPGAEGRRALDLADWWFDPAAAPPPPEAPAMGRAGPDGTLLTGDEFAVLGTALGRRGNRQHGRPVTLDEGLRRAGSLADVATVLGTVLGQRYQPPQSGPLAAHQRLLAAFARGQAQTVLAAAREIRSHGQAGSVVDGIAQAVAAEVHGMRGEPEEAGRCLSAVPTAPPFSGLHWWVTAGTAELHEYASALPTGVAALASAAGGGIGVELVLARVTELAAWVDRHDGPPQVARALAAIGTGAPPVSEGLHLLVRSVVEGDPTAAGEAAQLADADGDRHRHLTALLVAAGVSARTGADPTPWLRDAHDAAATFAPDARHGRRRTPHPLTERIGARLRAHGQRPGRRRADPLTFSAVETQIIELVRLGCTNRQIAARVRMSEKTVENHLSRLYARTGRRSRVELATLRPPSVGGHG